MSDKFDKKAKANGKKAYGKFRKRNPSNKGRTPGQSYETDITRKNVTLERMSSEASRLSQSSKIVFPEDSSSMNAAGVYTSTPGQENWIEQWNETIVESSSEHAPLTKTYGRFAKRTCNAMRIDVCPLFGPTEPISQSQLANPITMAGLNLKQFIDTTFGTKTDYDPQDLMLYLMGVAGVMPTIAEIKRDLRLAYTGMSDHYPAFVPKGLFTLLEISDNQGRWMNGEGYMYTVEHLRGYIDKLNQLIYLFNRLPIPPELGVIGYNDDLFDAIYMDTEDQQTAQLYVFKNSDYWEYIEHDENAPFPALMHWRTDTRSLDQKLNILSTQIERLTALRTSSSAMLQNLFNAYGSKDTIQVPSMDPINIEPLPFVYDEHILIMIENLVLCDQNLVDISHFMADADKQAVTGHLCIYNMFDGGSSLTANIPLQFHKDWEDVSHDDIGWALRLHPVFNVQKKDKVYSNRFTAGSDWDSYYADACMGYAIATQCFIARIGTGGAVQIDKLTYDTGDMMFYWGFAARDFHRFPVYRISTWDADAKKVSSIMYAADRDVEVTYRMADIIMHWVCLTDTLWASNVNRNVPGTRFKGKPDLV